MPSTGVGEEPVGRAEDGVTVQLQILMQVISQLVQLNSTADGYFSTTLFQFFILQQLLTACLYSVMIN